MKRIVPVLILLLLAELVVAGWFTFADRRVVVLPRPNLDGYSAFTRAKIDEAISQVRPEVAEDWHDLAELLFAGGIYAEAEACYRHAVDLKTTNPHLRYQWAFCLFTIGDCEQSDTQFLEAIRLGYKTPAACQYFRGLNALRNDQTDDARRAFEESREIPASRLELAELMVNAGELEASKELLDELVLEYPNARQIYHLLAVIAQKSGDKVTQRNYLALSDVMSEFVIGPWHHRATTVMENSQPLTVSYRTSVASERLKRSPNDRQLAASIEQEIEELWDPHLERLLADIDAAQGDQRSQIERLKKIIERDGVDAFRSLKLGLALVENRQFEEAEQVIAVGTRVPTGRAPDSTVSLFALLSQMRRTAGDLELADQLAARGVFVEGTQRLKELQIRKALSLFETATRLDGSIASYWFWLGRARQLLDERDAAVSAFDECLKRNPHHERALEIRDVLAPRDE